MTSLLNNHPLLKSLRAQLADIRTADPSGNAEDPASIENEAKVATLREQELDQQSNKVKANSAQAGEDEVGLNALQRGRAQRQLLENLSGKPARPPRAPTRIPSLCRCPHRLHRVQLVDPYFKVVQTVAVVSFATFIMTSIVIMLAELFSGRALRPISGYGTEERVEQETVEIVAVSPRARMAAPSMLAAVQQDEQDEREDEAAEELRRRATGRGKRILNRFRRPVPARQPRATRNRDLTDR